MKRASRSRFRPIFFLFSAPSGTGKGTLVRALLRNDRHLRRVVTCTTRARRRGERNGVHYHFFSRQQFAEAIERGEFIEWNEIYGDYYGTHRSLVARRVEQARRRRAELVESRNRKKRDSGAQPTDGSDAATASEGEGRPESEEE